MGAVPETVLMKMCSEIALKILTHLPGANELNDLAIIVCDVTGIGPLLQIRIT